MKTNQEMFDKVDFVNIEIPKFKKCPCILISYSILYNFVTMGIYFKTL